VFSFKSKTHSDCLNALVITPDGVSSATVKQNKHGKPLLQRCAYNALAPGQEMDDLLTKVIADMGKGPCSTLLDSSDYQLLMVEAPEVPSSELKAAIRWRIRDLIDFHIDDAALDVFDAPPSGARGVQEHLYTVVTRSALVKEKVDTLQNAGAALEIIDIPELALRNIAARLDQDAGGQATLYFGAEQGLVTLTRDATLFLARSLDIGYRQLKEAPDLVDRLALELQRSMDYYDRHFQQAPISAITLCPAPEPLPFIADQLNQQTGIEVHQIKMEELVDSASPVDDELFARCLLAIGTALRTEPTEL
jgi:MSHA biogenesis protein MshI